MSEPPLSELPDDRREAQPDTDRSTQVAHWVAALTAASDTDALVASWQQVPRDQAAAVLVAIEQAIVAADHAGAAEHSARLRQQLDGVRQLQAIREQVGHWAAALVAATEDAQVGQLWSEIPLPLEDAVLARVEQQALACEQAGDGQAAARAHHWIGTLRQMQEQGRAVMAQVEDWATALAAATEEAQVSQLWNEMLNWMKILNRIRASGI